MRVCLPWLKFNEDHYVRECVNPGDRAIFIWGKGRTWEAGSSHVHLTFTSGKAARRWADTCLREEGYYLI